MKIREIETKTLLSRVRHPDTWFGLVYTMDLYRGCAHQCIYCDTRSACDEIEDFGVRPVIDPRSAPPQAATTWKSLLCVLEEEGHLASIPTRARTRAGIRKKPSQALPS